MKEKYRHIERHLLDALKLTNSPLVDTWIRHVKPSPAEVVVANAWVQSWDQHIGRDGAIAVMNALKAAGYVIIKDRMDPGRDSRSVIDRSGSMTVLRPPHFDSKPLYTDGAGFGWVGYGIFFEWPSACFQIWVFK